MPPEEVERRIAKLTSDPEPIEDIAADARVSREQLNPSERKALIQSMALHFGEVTQLPVPLSGQDMDPKQRQFLWDRPLKTIGELALWDLDRAYELIDRAVGRMVKDGLTMQAPISIRAVAQSIYAEDRRERASMDRPAPQPRTQEDEDKLTRWMMGLDRE